MPVAEACPVVRKQKVLIASSREIFRRQCVESHVDVAYVGEAGGGAEVLAKLGTEDWDEVLLDKHLHDLDVGEVVRLIHSRHPELSVQVLDLDKKARDHDCWTTGEMSFGGRFSETGNLAPVVFDEYAHEIRSDSNPCSAEPLPGMIGSSLALEEVARLARLVGRRQTTVLITGETGTGKELVARGIHEVSSRAKGPFVVVNCAAIPEQLLEAELFGHARGAFTGAVQSRLGRIHVAHGGTLFLDEVGELPLSMQSKLLRFVQDGEVQRLGSSDVFRVDVRVVSATNVNLLERVKEKQFRQDLYYRLAVFPIELPPLRERRVDILPLAEYFLNKLSGQSAAPRKMLSASAAEMLLHHSWPGNVRELQHTIERAYILAEDQRQLRTTHFILPESAGLRKL